MKQLLNWGVLANFSGVTDDISALISRISLRDRLLLLSGISPWLTYPIEGVIPSLKLSDGPHGIRIVGGLDVRTSIPTTTFPVEAMVGQTWNPELVFKMGQAIAREAREQGVDVVLGPGMNGKRSPLGGRNFEYYSEDPFLSGAMASSMVSGIQSLGTAACPKHFVGNEQETNRFRVDSVIDERALREIYLAPFEHTVKTAVPWVIMTAYNGVNGEAASSSRRLLTEILRDEWGFDGVVVSDWGAVRDKVRSIRAGVDLEMPGPSVFQRALEHAVNSGQLGVDEIDLRVRNLLGLAGRVDRTPLEIDHGSHHDLARQIACEGMVLLENPQGILPFVEGTRLAVIGEYARTPRFQAGGSSHLNPRELDAALPFLEGLADVEFAPGYLDEVPDPALIQEAVEVAGRAESVVVFVGTTESTESEGFDRSDIEFPRSHLELVAAISVANPNTAVVVNAGSAMNVKPFQDSVAAILFASLPGEAGGSAIAEVLFGREEPSGRLAETFPQMVEHNPSYGFFGGPSPKAEYREGILVGYRHYDTRRLPVDYPFGHGLSYTTFDYSELSLSKDRIANSETLEVECTVTNTGDRPGREVVQVYVQDVESSVLKPQKELKGFRKVRLDPGANARVRVVLDERSFAHWDDTLGRFAVEGGEYQILVGASSRDIRLSASIEFVSKEDLRLPLTLEDSVQAWVDDDRYRFWGEKVLGLMDEFFAKEAVLVNLGAAVNANLNFMIQTDPSRRNEVEELRQEIAKASTL